MTRLTTAAIFAAYAASTPVANWLIGNVGDCIPDGPCLIPVGFGLAAPSGVLVIGAALALRDILQERAGLAVSLAATLVGAVISFVTGNPYIAAASALAFLFAEFADALVYTGLRKLSRWGAVLASGGVGALLDSMIFVFVAFGSLDLALGTFIAKTYASIAYAALVRWRK